MKKKYVLILYGKDNMSSIIRYTELKPHVSRGKDPYKSVIAHRKPYLEAQQENSYYLCYQEARLAGYTFAGKPIYQGF